MPWTDEQAQQLFVREFFVFKVLYRLMSCVSQVFRGAQEFPGRQLQDFDISVPLGKRKPMSGILVILLGVGHSA